MVKGGRGGGNYFLALSFLLHSRHCPDYLAPGLAFLFPVLAALLLAIVPVMLLVLPFYMKTGCIYHQAGVFLLLCIALLYLPVFALLPPGHMPRQYTGHPS